MGVEDANQLHGMAPESAASKIVDSLQNRESELVLAPLNVKMGFYIRNLTPNLFWWFLYRRAVKELEANAKANENVVT
jgi:hypothetical protein